MRKLTVALDFGYRPDMAEEDRKEKIDRELSELLEELRVAIPGAEVLFAFLLGVAFTERIHAATALQRNVYFATLLVTAGATATLIAPAAYHRLHFRDGHRDKEQMLFTATKLAIASLVMLMFAVAGSVFLVGDILYATWVGGAVGAGLAAWFLWFWFALPLIRRARSQESGDGTEPDALRDVRRTGGRPA